MAAPHILIAKHHADDAGVPTPRPAVRFPGPVNAEVVTARNFLASVMYERTQYTHLLFVDADMAFTPTSVEKLLDAGKPLIGCIYPKKRLNLATYARVAREQPVGQEQHETGSSGLRLFPPRARAAGPFGPPRHLQPLPQQRIGPGDAALAGDAKSRSAL